MTTVPAEIARGERLRARPAWKALAAHYRHVRRIHLRELFAADPKRGEHLTLEAAGLYLDFSKNRVTDETLRLLVRLADECGLRARIDTMWSSRRCPTTARPTPWSAATGRLSWVRFFACDKDRENA